MPKPKPPYPPEFRARIVELAKAGRTSSLAEEFHVTDTTVRNWVRQSELDEGTRQDGLTSDGRDLNPQPLGSKPKGITAPG
ncbi:IS3 family transposase OrfA [Myxococcus stipitatus DSM 14675]|uniref:IS3 family transposase OrfA n=1 Tax=Myxococcus stipitatus (strain DSM 14675 / JCM 12634 / Mx s8) TaxID=1278073 RepID=L7UGM2_MYXSD|nr:transposase [Myxococcus stipitatus]AGC45594.1 IS3 family transposase OrfA [Myxococcus stipitatus DSM 14675]